MVGRSEGGLVGAGRTTGVGRFRKRTTLVDSPAEADVGTAEAEVNSEGRVNDRAEGVDSTSDCGCGPSWPESVQPQPATIIFETSWSGSGDGEVQEKAAGVTGKGNGSVQELFCSGREASYGQR